MHCLFEAPAAAREHMLIVGNRPRSKVRFRYHRHGLRTRRRMSCAKPEISLDDMDLLGNGRQPVFSARHDPNESDRSAGMRGERRRGARARDSRHHFEHQWDVDTGSKVLPHAIVELAMQPGEIRQHGYFATRSCSRIGAIEAKIHALCRWRSRTCGRELAERSVGGRSCATTIEILDPFDLEQVATVRRLDRAFRSVTSTNVIGPKIDPRIGRKEAATIQGGGDATMKEIAGHLQFGRHPIALPAIPAGKGKRSIHQVSGHAMPPRRARMTSEKIDVVLNGFRCELR